MKTVVGIRCAAIGAIEINLYELLLNGFNHADVYFLVDSRGHRQTNIPESQIALVNPARQFMAVPDNWGWLCGDLFYYAFAVKVQADFYCMVESDVTMTANTVRNIANELGKDNSDYIAQGISPADSSWMWTPLMAPFVKQVYASAFPFTRISRRALEFLFPQRRLLNHLCIAGGTRIPNDESFVTSGLMNVPGFRLTELTSLIDLDTSKFSTVYQIPAELCDKDGFIYHSALPGQHFYNKLISRMTYDLYQESISARLDYAFLGDSRSDQFLEVFWRIAPREILAFAAEWEQSRALAADPSFP
ncbi:hypothetical protein [Herbaspirillum sp. alder98]|uniref:hypothetical protein n=1 Tax=Herbaspirillum sp. alder98 TaxID=2913096 RepID=UPI001CD87182|nr:hypothetical protein [Herbaspirillum sp. alder98]MCA1323783.1 hypothetical protein [Herbaspirillum sp. alder98]